MGKFTAGRSVNVRPDDEQQPAADIDLPAGAAPDINFAKQEQELPSGFQAFVDRQKTEPQAPVQEQQQAPVQEQVQQPETQPVTDERFRIPSIAERKQQTDALIGEAVRNTRWLQPDVVVNKEEGIFTRAAAAVQNANNGKLYLSARTTGEGFTAFTQGQLESGPELASVIDAEKEGSFAAAIHQAGAVEIKNVNGIDIQVPNDQYTAIASMVVENSFDDQVVKQKEFDFQSGGEVASVIEQETDEKVLKSDVSNAKLGQQIHQEYQRSQGAEQPTRLPKKQAETVGGAFKELFANTNPDLVETIVDPATNRKVYILNSNGQEALAESKEYRKRLFPSVNVRPSKNPLPEGELPGDVGANAVINIRGPVGNQHIGKKINTTRKNLSTIGHVVDKQRTKILYSAALPAIVSNDYTTWQAEIVGVGPSKLKKYAAKLKTEERKGNPNRYNPDTAMQAEIDSKAQAIRSIAMERSGANYLTYGVTAYNGRIDPQQTFFDPVRSKLVRAVTRSPVPVAVKPNSRADKNLRQMYAMMLVKKADKKLPDARELALIENTSKLEAWGDTLQQVITMTDEQYEAISQAIEQGIPLDDPNFPQVPQIEINDPELVAAIEKKGEDGIAFIDGLIDFSKYIKHHRQGMPHHTYFNATMDGKTNGLASDGMQMGNIPMAEATGVLRDSGTDLLDAGDIREQLKGVLIDSIKQGWDGNTSGFGIELNDVATNLFANDDFNKTITMTWGYGKDIKSFEADIQEYLDLIYEQASDSTFQTSYDLVNQTLGTDANGNNILVQTLLSKYEPALRQVVSSDAIESRAIRRAGAAIHAAIGQLFSYTGPAGNQLVFGRDVSKGQEDVTKSGVTITGSEGRIKREIPHYETEATSAAVRDRGGRPEPGGYARGGSVPGPVQSIDAATIAETFSGKSWDKLKAKSAGNPYAVTIYDAVKVDANSYDVVLEEINKNWLDINMNWSYLKEIDKSIDKAVNDFKQKIAQRGANDPLTDNERLYFDYLLAPSKTQRGTTELKNYRNMLMDIGNFKGDRTEQHNHTRTLMDKALAEMKKAGYDPLNPAAVPTLAHARLLVNLIVNQSNIKPRLAKAIKTTNDKKSKLKDEIKKRGFKASDGTMIPLQYYAH